METSRLRNSFPGTSERVMKYRNLGNTGLQVSEIGFGTWGIGGASNGSVSYGPTDDAESRKALEYALDRGVTFYDTADLYGYGHAESLLGATFKNVRDRVVIASKAGFLNQNGDQDFSPGHITKSIEASLKRLQCDYIDLYQLHDPPLSLIQQDPTISEALRVLKKEGKIRAYGMSVRTPEDGLIAVGKLGFNAVQVNFNMIDQRPRENGLMDLCRKMGVGVIARTPLCFGFLSGKYAAGMEFHNQDHRSRWSPEQIEVWANAYRLFRQGLSQTNDTEAQTALRYCLSYPEISTVIPGMLREEEVDENIAASQTGPLASKERENIETIYKQHTFFLGTSGLRSRS